MRPVQLLDDANILAVSAATLRPHLKVERLKKRGNLKRQFMRHCGVSALEGCLSFRDKALPETAACVSTLILFVPLSGLT